MKLLERIRQQKLLSTTLMLCTLGIGIVIGTLVNTGVNAAKAQNVAPDATPLVVPAAVEATNEFSKLAKKISPSVVNITADYMPKQVVTRNRRARPQGDDQEGNGDDGSAELFKRFFGNQAPGLVVPQDAGKREQSGTGFIVDKNGYIITNKHVVSTEEGNPVDHIKVKLHGEDTEYRGKLIGFDRETDIAVVKIDVHHPLQPVMLANSEGVQVGDWAVAIGSPFGLQETVTAGIVSALNRANIGEQFQRFIQTDAAINPGNSGGPLLNIRGEVIGVNTMIATRSGGYEGIGFALPINMAVRDYNDIIREGHVTRGSIGVTWQQNIKPETLKAMGFDHGVIVSDVKKDGPADKAGLKSDDIILAVNDKPLKDGDDLMSRVADMPVGTGCMLTVDRDGKRRDFKLVVQDRLKVFWDDPRVVGEVKNVPTANTEEERPETVSKVVQFGIQVRALGDDEKSLTTDKTGMVVTRVEPNSFAADIGMLDRDIITSIDRKPVNSVEDIKKIQSTLKPGDPVVFRVVRSIGGARRGAAGSTPASQVLWLPGTLPE
jgi:serine protease Do